MEGRLFCNAGEKYLCSPAGGGGARKERKSPERRSFPAVVPSPHPVGVGQLYRGGNRGYLCNCGGGPGENSAGAAGGRSHRQAGGGPGAALRRGLFDGASGQGCAGYHRGRPFFIPPYPGGGLGRPPGKGERRHHHRRRLEKPHGGGGAALHHPLRLVPRGEAAGAPGKGDRGQ